MIDRRRLLIATAAGITGCTRSTESHLTVAAASSLRGITRDISSAWHDASPMNYPIRWIVAASGTLATQIRRGMRVELFLAADRARAETVARWAVASRAINAASRSAGGARVAGEDRLTREDQFNAEDQPLANIVARPYARGRLAWYPQEPSSAPERIAIPNPHVAPYGRAAARLIGTLPWGRNVSIVHAASAAGVIQMVDAGSCPLGVTAASVAIPQGRRIRGGQIRGGQIRGGQIIGHDASGLVEHHGVCLRPDSPPAVSLDRFLRSTEMDLVWRRHGLEPAVGNDV